MAVLDCDKKCSLNQFLKFFFILALEGDIILLIFIAGSKRKGLQTKKCWFAFLVLIIETPMKRPANKVDSTYVTHFLIDWMLRGFKSIGIFSDRTNPRSRDPL